MRETMGNNAYGRRWKFANGYEASVIRNKYSYGHELGLYELAVFKDGDLDYTTHITDDVLGYLTPREVVYKLREIEALSNYKTTIIN